MDKSVSFGATDSFEYTQEDIEDGFAYEDEGSMMDIDAIQPLSGSFNVEYKENGNNHTGNRDNAIKRTGRGGRGRGRGRKKASSFLEKKKRITTGASMILDDRLLPENLNAPVGSVKYIPFPENTTHEEQLILRVPPSIAMKLYSGEISAESFSFEFQDERHGILRISREKIITLSTILVDLPCIIETHKTSSDKRVFYKIADICQMLIVLFQNDISEDIGKLSADLIYQQEMKETLEFMSKTSNPYEWPHGLTSPMHGVLENRFKKTAFYKTQASKQSIQEIEKIVSELLEADRKSLSVEYDLQDASIAEGLKQQKESTGRDRKILAASMDDGDLEIDDDVSSGDSDLAAEIEYGLLEDEDEKVSTHKSRRSQISMTTGFMSESVDDVSLDISLESSIEHAQSESIHYTSHKGGITTDFSFLKRSLSARLQRVKSTGNGSQDKKQSFSEMHDTATEDVSSDIVMLFKDLEKTG
jgi:TATA-binding protein-associated factor Taf7